MAREATGVVASTSAATAASTVARERVEIVTRGEGRRSYSAEEKARLLAETVAAGARVSEVAQRHGICASLLHRWRREAEGRPVRRPTRRAAPRHPSCPSSSKRPHHASARANSSADFHAPARHGANSATKTCP
jgi:transposase